MSEILRHEGIDSL